VRPVGVVQAAEPARDAVVVEAVRTAVGKRNGALSQAHAADLSADVLTALAARTGIDPAVVDDVIWGCVGQVGDQAANIGRYAGASGAVLMTRMINHMRDHDLRYGLQVMCEGGGTSNTTLVELAG
jgi:acetyl-CoA acetyltransferase